MSIRSNTLLAPVIFAVSLFASNAVLATDFSVSVSINVSGITSGSGSGGGTATLDEVAGTLTLNLNSSTATGFTDTSVVTVATISGTYSPDSLSSVSGTSQLISCTNNGGLVNGCNSINSDFGTAFLTDPIDFDLSPLGVTVFTVRDSNSGADIEQVFTLITGGTPPPGPPATIDLTSGGPTQYSFDPGNGHTVTLTISSNSGSVTQGSSGLGNHTGFLDDGAVDNYATGSSRETLNFVFSEPVILDSVALDLFEPIATSERAELALDGGGVTVIDENNASRTGGDLSNWEYIVDSQVSAFTLGSPARSGIIGDTTFRINSLVVSSPPPVDSDGDGLLDDVETNTGIYVDANDTGTDPADNDSDDDGLLDGAEVSLGTNPVDDDSDDDGLLDGAEIGAGTDPLDSDTDDDGVSDGDEIAGGTDPTVSQRPCDIDPVAGVSLGDVLLLQRHLNNSQPLSPNAQVFCDVNTDGVVTLADMLALQRLLLGH